TRMPARRPLAAFARLACIVTAAAASALAACDPGRGVVSLSKQEPARPPRTDPTPGGPRVGAIAMAAPTLPNPHRKSPKLGYLRAGGTVVRGEDPVSHDDCEGGWYRVLPIGYVCASNDATTDTTHPLLRALTKRPDQSKPMPYAYAFVRAIAPNYYR